jgi:hypothetical protein
MFRQLIPSPGSVWVTSELFMCWSDWVVGYLVCSRMTYYVTACQQTVTLVDLPPSDFNGQVTQKVLKYSLMMELIAEECRSRYME